MRYDTVIIGGGLGGLIGGITLARRGQRVAIISSGKSALHFCSGSLELWGGSREEFEQLPQSHPSHPYNKVGMQRLVRYSAEAKELFARAGVPLVGGLEQVADSQRFGCSHYRLSPIGAIKPAWLTMDEFVTFAEPEPKEYPRVTIVAIQGYLDFYPEFIASSLRKRGVECKVVTVTSAALEALRESATEMRAVSIARSLQGEALDELAHIIGKAVGEDADLALVPAVFGLKSRAAYERVAQVVGVPVRVAPTVSASVPGVRMQRLLSEEFQRCGGEYILGDRVVDYTLEEGRIVSLRTANHSDMEFRADSYILASGSFFGRGLEAQPNGIREVVFGLDVECDDSRAEWCGEHILDTQPFQRYGVRCDERLRPSIAGQTIENLYAVGSVLAGADPVKEGCGAGVVVATAFMAAEDILSCNDKK